VTIYDHQLVGLWVAPTWAGRAAGKNTLALLPVGRLGCKGVCVLSPKTAQQWPTETPEGRARACAFEVADATEWLQREAERAGYPSFHSAQLRTLLDEARRLRNALEWLRESLRDETLRQQLAETHAETVTFAGETEFSYLEAVFSAGERRYETVRMLCQHGVLFAYDRRLHPRCTRLTESFSEIPALEQIQWRQPDGSCLDSPEHLLRRICEELKSLPAVDREHARTALEKEFAAEAARSHTPTTAPKHGDDFRSVRWRGQSYSFTAKQAPAVKLLWQNYHQGTPDVGDETLLLAVDPEAPPANLRTLFRDHPAWGTMIVAGGSKGTHRLN
jgi:hypothetical protein